MRSSAPESEFAPPQIPKTRRFKSLRVILALMLRELESSESRSSLGFLWTFLEPVATIALMSVVFGLVSRTPPIGTNFPLYYLTGVAPFGLYMALANKSAAALRASRSLLGFPAVKPIDAIIARALLNFVIEVLVFLILAAIIIYFWSLRPHIQPIIVIEALLLAAMWGLSVGCFNAVFFLMVPAYATLWTVVNRPLMLASGVLIPISSIPEPYATYLWWNPIAHPVELMRAAFYSEVTPTHASPLYVILMSLGAFTFGMVMLHRYVRDAMDD